MVRRWQLQGGNTLGRCKVKCYRTGSNPVLTTNWRDGRVVEYTALEKRHTVKGIWGSNPCLSAKKSR